METFDKNERDDMLIETKKDSSFLKKEDSRYSTSTDEIGKERLSGFGQYSFSKRVNPSDKTELEI